MTRRVHEDYFEALSDLAGAIECIELLEEDDEVKNSDSTLGEVLHAKGHLASAFVNLWQNIENANWDDDDEADADGEPAGGGDLPAKPDDTGE